MPRGEAAAEGDRDRATEIDLGMAAAAAMELAERSAAPDVEHGTLISGPIPESLSAPRRSAASGFAPTAIHAAPTADTPPTVELEPIDELPEGTLLAGRYHVSRLIGHGGMGAVYAAHDDDLDEDIALKVLRPDLARDADFKRRLKAEVRLARRVSHPNVCRVHDFGLDDEVVFVTMELVRGNTLRERLAEARIGRAEPLELTAIVDIITQIGNALSAAHRAGVIHRDVKPDNVILAAGRAVLTDFGVASMIEGAAQSVVGTPSYLAPEVLRGDALDHRVDVYAVSAMAYELIAGAPPFAARTLGAALELASNRPDYPGLPDAFGTPVVRNALDRVLARGLASDPLQRAPTIERFIDAFAHAARGAPLSPSLSGRGSNPFLTPIDASTPVPMTRRNEQRITTALVWQANRGERDTQDAERLVVGAGGTPIRVTPGEIVALFGARHSTGDDSDRAAHTALALISRFGGRAGLDTTRVLVRAGDTVVAGPDSASSAATLAQDAGPGEVRASKGTARQLAARFEISATNGVARRVMAAIRPSRRQRATPPGRRKLETENVRSSELALISAQVERALQDREPLSLEVRGAAGSGKTYLRKELVAAIAAHHDVDWLFAMTSPVDDPTPLSVIRSAHAEWYDAIARANDTAERHAAAERWVKARASRRPVVLIIEDAQWCDPSSRAVLDHLRNALTAVPVAIVTFVRSDSAAGAPFGAKVVWLGALDHETARRVARSNAPTAPPEVIEQVVGRAAGNPFFIEELVRDIGSSAGLPPTIEAVIQAQLDQLSEPAAQTVVAAATIGTGFWREAVMRLVPGLGDAVLDEALGELERYGFIRSAAPPILSGDYFEFTSTLVREVAYARISARERRHHHAVIAGWLDEQPRTKRDEVRLLAVGEHRERAGDAPRAAAAYRQAGTLCAKGFAFADATVALRKAASLSSVPDPRLDEDLADAVAQHEGYANAEAIYQRALDETDDDDEPSRARLWYKLGLAASKRGATANAIARFTTGLAIAAPGGVLAAWAHADPRTPALLWAGLGWTLGYLLGRADDGHPHCERAVAVLENTVHRRELAFALSRLGGTYMRAGRFDDQRRCNQRNLEIAIELGDLELQVTALINLGVVHGVLGDLDDAVATTGAARELARKLGSASSEGIAASNLAGLYIELGRIAEADALLDDGIALVESTGTRYVLCESLVFRARIAAARGDLVAARRHAATSLTLARSLGNQLDVAIALRIIAQIDSRTGDIETARQGIEQALVLAVVHDELETLRTRAARARILAVAADPTAVDELTHLRDELTQLGLKRELAVLDQLTEVR